MDGGEIGSSIDLSLYLQGRTLKGYAVRIYLHMYFSILFIYCQSKERERVDGRSPPPGDEEKKRIMRVERAEPLLGVFTKTCFCLFPFYFSISEEMKIRRRPGAPFLAGQK